MLIKTLGLIPDRIHSWQLHYIRISQSLRIYNYSNPCLQRISIILTSGKSNWNKDNQKNIHQVPCFLQLDRRSIEKEARIFHLFIHQGHMKRVRKCKTYKRISLTILNKIKVILKLLYKELPNSLKINTTTNLWSDFQNSLKQRKLN